MAVKRGQGGMKMLTNREMKEIALRQSAFDCNCEAADFLREENVVCFAGLGPDAKKYYQEPLTCTMVSYGNNIVASVKGEYRAMIQEYISRFSWYHCFETPNLHWLQDRLTPLGQKVCFMAEYFLPDTDRLRPLSCAYELRTLTQKDFASLYLPEWGNALCEKRKELDVLGVGAYDHGVLIGLAGCSADAAEMLQIGVDVLPAYRRKGIAKALTSRLALEILNRDKVPFYCCAWSNVRSARNAIACGFSPAWVEMSVKPAAIVDEMNGEQAHPSRSR